MHGDGTANRNSFAGKLVHADRWLRRGCVFDKTASSDRQFRLPRTVCAVLALASASVVFAACGSSHNASAKQAPAGDAMVIKNFAFEPSTLSVAPGATVTVRNEDSATHTVTATGSSHAFDTKDIQAGGTATFTAPSSPGSYPYICEIHQFMHGTLNVR